MNKEQNIQRENSGERNPENGIMKEHLPPDSHAPPLETNNPVQSGDQPEGQQPENKNMEIHADHLHKANDMITLLKEEYHLE